MFNQLGEKNRMFTALLLLKVVEKAVDIIDLSISTFDKALDKFDDILDNI